MPNSYRLVVLFVPLCLTACGSGPEITCTMPTMPTQGSSETAWSLYRSDLDAYSQCMAVKTKSGASTALDKVDSAADTTKAWVAKARSHL